MDPATAIGVVSGILSFVLFAGKLVKGGLEIYHNGDLAENATLQDVTTRMESFHSQLAQVSTQSQILSGNAKEIQDLAKDCSKVSAELLRLLKSMEGPGSKGVRVIWAVLVASWNSVLHGIEKKELEESLGRCHGRLALLLTWSTSLNINQVISALEKRNAGLEAVQESIRELNAHLRRGSEMDWLGDLVRREIKQAAQIQERDLFHFYHTRILRLLKYDKMRERSDGLKERLAEIDDRQKENGGTFQWIFEAESDNISDCEGERRMEWEARTKWNNWISAKSQSGIFHIAGKFGSGKSTLMQFLSDHPRTQEHLEQWAGVRKLVKVNYYFSVVIGGTQQLLRGLYRTLLHDILVQCPELTRVILPETWTTVAKVPWKYGDTGSTVEISESVISTAVTKLLTYNRSDLCFAIFVDGLDEYQDPEGCDQSDLVDLLYQWAPTTHSNVKLCVASREEAAFYNKFPQETTIRLHELTRFDMERFIEERLRKIRNQRLRDELVKAISIKAEGVFLWTRLVVQEIREDLEIGDVDVDVLNRFPAGLRPLLDRTMESIPLRHRQKAYLSFAILIELSEFNSKEGKLGRLVLSDIACSFLDDYCKNPQFVYTMPVSRWWDVDYHKTEDPAARAVMERTKKVPQQLRAWCKGLVETVPQVSYEGETNRMRIVFSHRSIRDYFDELAIRDKLSTGLTGFSVPDALSHLLLAEFTHNGLYSEPKYYSENRWDLGLLELRQSHSLDRPPFTFLNRWQHVSSQRKLYSELRFFEFKVGDTELYGLRTSSENFDRIKENLAARGISEIGLHEPLYCCVVGGEYQYPLWKLHQDPSVLENTFRLTPVLYSTLCHILGGELNNRNQSEHALEFLNLLLTLAPKKCLELLSQFFSMTAYKNLTIHYLTLWHRYLTMELNFGKAKLRNRSETWTKPVPVSFDGFVLENFLRAGADPYLLLTSSTDTAGPVTLELGHRGTNTRRCVFHDLEYDDYQDALMFKNPFTLRDWVDLSDLPNRDTLLDLIDRGLTAQQSSNLNEELQQEENRTAVKLQPQLMESRSTTPTCPSDQDDVEETAPTTKKISHRASFRTDYVVVFLFGVLSAYIVFIFWK
ncbi:hypothetical protein QBC42DRAFT_84161 [Cladorrhinum samala]|uniref:NACHT domain-containing protein n=1 Tax=Cladorrhinum samala TaxID=585594 RepID=A0AAV9HQY2_9PEZI|nr:hypothetical protein QBC42DRAFT_84161 [Cladorrhinum samala]